MKQAVLKWFPSILALGYPYSTQALDALALWMSTDKKPVVAMVATPEWATLLNNLFKDCGNSFFFSFSFSFSQPLSFRVFRRPAVEEPSSRIRGK